MSIALFDMKQEELARLVGVRRETIGNLEKGRYNPSLALAWRIAQVFKVPIEDVFTVVQKKAVAAHFFMVSRNISSGVTQKYSKNTRKAKNG